MKPCDRRELRHFPDPPCDRREVKHVPDPPRDRREVKRIRIHPVMQMLFELVKKTFSQCKQSLFVEDYPLLNDANMTNVNQSCIVPITLVT